MAEFESLCSIASAPLAPAEMPDGALMLVEVDGRVCKLTWANFLIALAALEPPSPAIMFDVVAATSADDLEVGVAWGDAYNLGPDFGTTTNIPLNYFPAGMISNSTAFIAPDDELIYCDDGISATLTVADSNNEVLGTVDLWGSSGNWMLFDPIPWTLVDGETYNITITPVAACA